jgi:membrane protein implicated in regulation of membrane protease activity
MPLDEREQRILEEIERRLAEEDPRLVESVSKATVATHALRRIRWGLIAFVVGFILLLLFVVNMWFALAGFVVMLGSGLLVYHYLKRMGRDQLRSYGERGGHFSLTAALARLAERLRRPRGTG